MQIQFNIDRHIKAFENPTVRLSALISERLGNFSDQITRIEIRLTNENVSRGGRNENRCVLEASLEGLAPIVVTSLANTQEQAVEEAIEKMKSSLDAITRRSGSQ